MNKKEDTEKKSSFIIVITMIVAIVGGIAAFMSDLETIQQWLSRNTGIDFKTAAQIDREKENQIKELKTTASSKYDLLHDNLFGLESHFSDYNTFVESKINCYKKILGERVVFTTGSMGFGPPPAPYPTDASEEEKNIARLRVNSLINNERIYFREKMKLLEELYVTGVPNENIENIKSEAKKLKMTDIELKLLNIVRYNINSQNTSDDLTVLISDLDKAQLVIKSTIRELQNRKNTYQVKDDLDC